MSATISASMAPSSSPATPPSNVTPASDPEATFPGDGQTPNAEATTPTSGDPAAPPGTAPPDGSPPTAPFATVLDDQVARTAAAEGQKKSTAPAKDAKDATVATDASSTVPGTPAAPTPTAPITSDAPAQPAPAQPAPDAAAPAPAPLPVNAALLAGAAAVAAAQPAPATTATTADAPVTTAPTASAPVSPTTTALATAIPAPDADPSPVSAALTPTPAPAPAAAKPTEAPKASATPDSDTSATAAATATLAGGSAAQNHTSGDHARDTADQVGSLDLQASHRDLRARGALSTVLGTPTTATPDAPAHAAATADPGALPATNAGGGLTATDAVTPRSLPTAPPAPYTVRLAEAPDAVRSTISLAARGGVSQARIELAPESLGGIQIHLQHTDSGLVARVVADRPEAAQMLARNSDDLRRSLEQSGTQLLRLDISTAGGQDGSASRGASGDRLATTSPGGGSARLDGDGAGGDGSAVTTTTTSTLGLATATLVDVLA